MTSNKIRTFIDNANGVNVQSKSHANYFVHSNQVKTAKDILKDFAIDNIRWSILLAQPQSGKSGVFFTVAYMMIKNPELKKQFKIKNVYVITGMNESLLYDQFMKDFNYYLQEPEMDSNVLKNSDLKRYVDVAEKMKSRIALTAHEELIEEKIITMRKDSLFIIDESDYAANVDSKLHLFLTKVIGIEPVGNKELMTKQNVFVLSVSATAIAELLSEKLIETDETYAMAPQKGWRVLSAGKGYYGIPNMFDKKLIFESFHIKKDTIEDFEDILKLQKKRMTANKKIGYVLVRCSKKEVDYLVNSEYINKNWEVKSIHGDTSKIGLGFLKNVPTKPTLVIIKGTLRAGKRLIGKENVFMVRETPKTLSDTATQGLLGRMCGYYDKQPNGNELTHFYCDVKAAAQYVEWKNHGFKAEFSPDAKNIEKIRTLQGTNKYGFSLSAAEIPLAISFPLTIINKISEFKGGDSTEFILKTILSKYKHKANSNQIAIIEDVLTYKNKKPHLTSIYQNVTSEDVRNKQFKPLKNGSLNKKKTFTSFYMNGNGVLSIKDMNEEEYTDKVKKYLQTYFISVVVDKTNKEVVIGFGSFDKSPKVNNLKKVKETSLYCVK